MRSTLRIEAWLLLGVVVVGSCWPRVVHAAYVTMVNNGPSSNRVNIMFLGDGYMASEIGTTYVNNINAMLDHMFNSGEDPFPRYRNFFNVYRVDVVSPESGADIPPQGIFRNTALDASYYFDGSTERLLSINGSTASDVLDAALAGSNLQVHMRLVTVNDSLYGGAGGSFSVYAGGNSAATEIALHELGHSFAGLADEYGGNPGPYTGPEPPEPDVTKSSSGQKWSQWLGYNQPGIGVIGAYEGGRYYDTGIYRPSLNSKMRTLGAPFDAVGRERFILGIYDRVNPLDSWLPNAGVLNDPANLWVDVIDPNVIGVEWRVNGLLVAGAASESFDPRDYGFAPGTYTITARAFDSTDWVRINLGALQQTINWNVKLLAIPGDLDGNYRVDIFDLNLVSTNWGGPGPAGDANGDHVVDIFDINVLSAYWTTGGGAVAVAEPSAFCLAALGGAVLAVVSRRRRSVWQPGPIDL